MKRYLLPIFAVWMLLACSAGDAAASITDFAVFGNGDVTITTDSTGSGVEGDVHTNNNFTISNMAVVTGFTSAVGTVTKAGSSELQGGYAEHVSPVSFPSLATILSNVGPYTTLTGDQFFGSNATFSGIYFVDGTLTFNYGASGTATFIVTKDIVLTGNSSLHAFVNPDSNFKYGLALYSGKTITVDDARLFGSMAAKDSITIVGKSEISSDCFSPTVPEPCAMSLLGIGLLGLRFFAIKRKRSPLV